jgi:hypothetical protein
MTRDVFSHLAVVVKTDFTNPIKINSPGNRCGFPFGRIMQASDQWAKFST